jgi:hypothetical protein
MEHPMSDLAPGGNDPEAGVRQDLGVSLHEWTTRWEEIEEDHADAPGESLEEAVDLLDEVLAERGVPVDGDPAEPETEDVIKAFEAARDVVRRWRNDEPVGDDELADAFDDARLAFAYVVGGHRGGDQPGA